MAKLLDWFSRKAGGKEWISWFTINQYVQDVKAFLKFSGYDDPEKFLKVNKKKPRDLVAIINHWISDMNERGKSPRTQTTRASALRRWLTVNDASLSYWH